MGALYVTGRQFAASSQMSRLPARLTSATLETRSQRATLDRLESLLSTAEKRATNSPASDWVHLTRLTFNYVKLTAQGFSQYRWFKSAPDMAKYRAMSATVHPPSL